MVVPKEPFIQYRVMYKVWPDDIQQVIQSMKVNSLETLHRAMVNLTGMTRPMCEWEEFVAHCVVDGNVREYGKMFLGCMYDDNFTFKGRNKDKAEEPTFFVKGLLPVPSVVSVGKASSIFDCTYFNYFKE